MFKLHQIEKLNFWFSNGDSRCTYALTYHEKNNIIHCFNLAYPNTHSLYSCLTSNNSKEFLGKIRNQLKFAMRQDVPEDARIFFYDRTHIVFEFNQKEGNCEPLLQSEWHLIYSAYLKPLYTSLDLKKGSVIIE